MLDDNAVITAIKGVLESISSIKEVHGAFPEQFEQYPAAVILPVSWDDSLADLRDTRIDATYQIAIYNHLSPDYKSGQERLREIVREVKALLTNQDNIRLGGVCDFSRLTSGRYELDNGEARQCSCYLEYRITKRFNRYSS